MSNTLSNSEEQYNPGSEWYGPAYNFKDQYTNLDATVLNKILKSVYDKTQYLKNNLDSFRESFLNHAIKIGLASFVQLNGKITASSPTQISGDSTLFSMDLMPGDKIRVKKDISTYLYYTIKSIETQTSLTIDETINASDFFVGVQFSLFKINKDYELINSEITSNMDPTKDLISNIELIGDYVKNVDDKLTEVIDGIGFDPTTGQSLFDNLTLNELVLEINDNILNLSKIIENINSSSGFNSNGTIGSYYSTYYVASGESLIDAISTLDNAINGLSFADEATLNNLIVTCGAKIDGSHAGYPVLRRYIKDGNPNYFDTFIDIDSKMNMFPGMFDVILDPSQATVKHPPNICTTMMELVAYINANGPNLNIFISNTGTYINSITENALTLYVDKLSGCTFYGEQTIINQSFIITKLADAEFTAIKFYNFVFKMTEISTADSLYDIFILSGIGSNQLGKQITEQLIQFNNCKFIPFWETVPVDVSDRALISINSNTDIAVSDTTIEFNHCHSTGYAYNEDIKDKDYVAPFIRHTSSTGASASTIKIRIISSDLFGHWIVNSAGAGPTDLTYVKELVVKDSYLTDHFYIFNFDNYGPKAEFSNSKFEQLYSGEDCETLDNFINLEIGAFPLELPKFNISDCEFKHNNVINIEAWEIHEFGCTYYSSRVTGAVAADTATLLHTAKTHKKNNNKYFYSPHNLMHHYLEIKTYDTYEETLSIANLSFINSDDSAFLAGAVGVTGCVLYINENNNGKIGVIKDIDIYHEVGGGTRPLFHMSGNRHKLLVENILYTMDKTHVPMQGTGLLWKEGANQNFIYIGQGSDYNASNAFTFNTNKLIDLGEFTSDIVPDALTIINTGLYRLTITNMNPTPSSGLTTAAVDIANNAPFSNYSINIFPLGRMLPALTSGIIGNQAIDGETFDTVLELFEDATIVVSIAPHAELELRIILERIK